MKNKLFKQFGLGILMIVLSCQAYRAHSQTAYPLRGVDNNVYALAVDTMSNVYVGGDFLNAGAVSVQHIAFWNPSSMVWSPLYASAVGYGSSDGVAGGVSIVNPNGGRALDNGVVKAIAIGPDKKVYVGGQFASAGGGGSVNFAVWDPLHTNWNSSAYGVDNVNGARPDLNTVVNGMTIANGK